MSPLPPGWITIADYVAMTYPAKGSSLRRRILAAHFAAAVLLAASIAVPIAIVYLAVGLVVP